MIILDPSTLPNFSSDADPAVLQSTTFQAVRYSLWLTLTWIVYVMSAFLSNGLPALIVGIVTFIYGECSERIRQKLDLIPAVKSWLHAVIISVGALIIHTIVFYQRNLVQSWQDTMSVLTTLLIISVVLFLQRMFVQNLAYNFHLVSYKDRIAQSSHELEILDALKRAIRAFGLANLFGNAETPRSVNLGDSRILPKFFRNSTNGSNKDMPFIVEIKSKSDSKAELIELNEKVVDQPRSRFASRDTSPNYASLDKAKRDISNDQSAKQSLNRPNQSNLLDAKERTGTLAIGKKNKEKVKRNFELYGEKHAISLANELFHSLDPGVQAITVDSFKKYISNEEMANQAFRVFDKDGDGSVSLSEFELTVRRIYGEKRALNDSLGDLSEALGNLNKCLYVFSILIAFLCAFPVWGISINAIIPFTSLLLALSFVFGASARKTFDCIIFLFVSHPFDSGDLIKVDDKFYTVLEQSILQTTVTVEGKTIYFPNRNSLLIRFVG